MLKSCYSKFILLLAIITSLILYLPVLGTSLSLGRLALILSPLFAGVLFLIGFLVVDKNSIHIKGKICAETAAIIASLGLLIGFLSLGLSFLSLFYFDSPQIDFLIRIIRIVVPLFLFLAFAGLGLFAASYSQRNQMSNSSDKGTLIQLLLDGRIVWQWSILLLACLVVLAAFLPIRRNYSPSFDSSIFSYIGQQILKGRTPYLEAWDHKPALIFYVNALGLWLANGQLIGIWMLELIALFAGSVILFTVLKKTFSVGLSLLVVVISVLHFIRLFDFGNYTEELSLLFQLTAFGLAFSRWAEKRLKSVWFLSGILCGLAFTSKQNTIGIWLSLILLEFLIVISNRNDSKETFHRFLLEMLIFGSGFLLVNLAWVLLFYRAGALQEYWDTAFVYNFVYSQKSSESRLATWGTTLTFLPGISLFLLLAFLNWFASMTDLVIRYREGHPWREVIRMNQLQLLALIWLPVELAMAGISGMNYQHYFILCIPPACILAAFLAQSLKEIFGIGMRSTRAMAAVSLLLITSSLPLSPLFRESYQTRNPSAMTKTADFLIENTNENDPIQLWGGSVAPYVMTNRSSPSRYFNVRPLYLISGYLQEEQWKQFLSDLMVSPPEYIIYMHDRFINPVPKIANGFCLAGNVTDYQRATFDFLCENYRFQESINEGMNDEWSVFVKVP
ncbi:MAG: hypothetical protein GX933_09595 [Chloroflexi bacterium]|nr:hypothetical protein [Chloroflexota bacterium]